MVDQTTATLRLARTLVRFSAVLVFIFPSPEEAMVLTTTAATMMMVVAIVKQQQ